MNTDKEFTRQDMIDFFDNKIKYGRESTKGWFMLFPFDPDKERTYLTTSQVLDKFLETK